MTTALAMVPAVLAAMVMETLGMASLEAARVAVAMVVAVMMVVAMAVEERVAGKEATASTLDKAQAADCIDSKHNLRSELEVTRREHCRLHIQDCTGAIDDHSTSIGGDAARPKSCVTPQPCASGPLDSRHVSPGCTREIHVDLREWKVSAHSVEKFHSQDVCTQVRVS